MASKQTKVVGTGMHVLVLDQLADHIWSSFSGALSAQFIKGL
jgi:hypothetical protein